MAEEMKKFPYLVLPYWGKWLWHASWKECSCGCYLSKYWQCIIV